jgi:hypothetical protein
MSWPLLCSVCDRPTQSRGSLFVPWLCNPICDSCVQWATKHIVYGGDEELERDPYEHFKPSNAFLYGSIRRGTFA